MARTIRTVPMQPDHLHVWSHVTDDGSDYDERIGRVVKLGPRRYAPTTEGGKRLEIVDSRAAAVALLMGEYACGAPTYRR